MSHNRKFMKGFQIDVGSIALVHHKNKVSRVQSLQNQFFLTKNTGHVTGLRSFTDKMSLFKAQINERSNKTDHLLSGQRDNQMKRARGPYKNNLSLLKFSFQMKIFLVAFIYRYALISVIRDKYIGDNSTENFFLSSTCSSSISGSRYDSCTEGRPGVT